MKLKLFTILAVLSLILSQISVNADVEQTNIATVDVQKVVSSSSQVKNLKKEQIKRQKELQAFVKKAKSEIKKQKTDELKAELSQKYEKQLADKKSFYANDYATKVKLIDKNINEKIQKTAQEMGYTMVLSKTSVVMDSDDITNNVIKAIK